MAIINPHINFNGNAEEAFTFYKSVFGGEFAKIIRFKDLASPEFSVGHRGGGRARRSAGRGRRPAAAGGRHGTVEAPP